MAGAAQHYATGYLLCGSGDHIAPVPKIYAPGVEGDLRCAECGEPMLLVDVIVLDRHPAISSLDVGYPRWGRRWYEAGAIIREISERERRTA